MGACPVYWSFRTCWLHHCKEVKTLCPGYNTKLHLIVRLQLWGMWSTPSLPLLPGSLWPRLVVPFWVPSIGQIEQLNHLLTIIIITYLKWFDCVKVIYIYIYILYRSNWSIELLVFDRNTWNHLTVCKQIVMLILLHGVICNAISGQGVHVTPVP